MVSLWNRGKAPFTIQPMDRIAQLVVVPVHAGASSRWWRNSPPARAAPAASDLRGRDRGKGEEQHPFPVLSGEGIGPDVAGPAPGVVRLGLAARGRHAAGALHRHQGALAGVPLVHRRDADRLVLRDEAVAGVDDLERAGARGRSGARRSPRRRSWRGCWPCCADLGIAGADSVASPSTCTPFTAFDSMVRQSTSHQRLLVVMRPACAAMSPARCGGTTFSTSPFTSSNSSFTVIALRVDAHRACELPRYSMMPGIELRPRRLEERPLGGDVRIRVEHQDLGARLRLLEVGRHHADALVRARAGSGRARAESTGRRRRRRASARAGARSATVCGPAFHACSTRPACIACS